MNTIAQQLKTGLYMATQSFSMLWYQKKFLIYLGSVALINIGLKIIAANLSNGAPFFSLFKLIHHHIATLPIWTEPLETLIGLFIANMLTMFFTIALLHHIHDSIEGFATSIRKHFINSLAKLKTICWWAALSSVLEIGMGSLIERASTIEQHAASALGYIVLSAVILAWLLATYFVLPMIAIHHQSLPSLIRLSARISIDMIAKIIGGESWFGLMILLVATPFLLIWLIANQPSLNPLIPMLGLLSAEILVKCWIATAHSIFKMILLQSRNSPKIPESMSA